MISVIEGEVSADRIAVIPISLPLSDGTSRTLQMMVDTGFNGYLMLPPDLIELTDAQWLGPRPSLIANGSMTDLPSYVLDVQWEGRLRRVLCLSAPNCHLVGMSLMYGYTLRMDVVDGGRVTIRQTLE